MALNNVDFDGDGRSEIPVTGSSGIGVLKLSGSAISSSVMAANGNRLGDWMLNTGENRFDLVADFDGDGRSDVLVSSPWGIGILRQSGNSLVRVMAAQNGTRFGGWLLNTADNRFGPAADFDGDGKPEILVTSPWGLGLLKLQGDSLVVLMMAANGSRFGGWLLNTADNRFGPVGDVDGDGRAEIVVSSPWGLGVLKYSSGALTALTMSPNGTRLGSWHLNSDDNQVVRVADYDGDGRAEILVTSPWSLGMLRWTGSAFTSPILAANGTRIGGWLLNTLDNRLGPVADFDGDGRAEILLASPWGIGILEVASGALAVNVMAANGTRIGGWLLNTADNYFDVAGDFDGDNRAELAVSSPWGLGILKFFPGAPAALAMSANGSQLGSWPLNTASDRFGMGPQILRLHVKILTAPDIPIERMITSMQWVYESVGPIVHRASTEMLDLPDFDDLDAGACVRGAVTEEQTQLFAHRANAGPNDVVVYFVRSLSPPYAGCAAHPPGLPSAVVVKGASRWTMAQELGHVLGLSHVADLNRLMTGGGTVNITNPPPDLIAQEVIRMRASTITQMV